MSYDNNLGLTIQVDPSQANAAFKSVNTSILGLETQMASSTRVMSSSVDRMAADTARGMNRSSAEITRASQAMQVLSTRLGLQLPEAANRFIGSSKLMGAALTTISSGVMWGAIISSAAMLIGKLVEWGKESEEVTKRNQELKKSIDDEVKSLDEYYDRLEKIKRARGLIGLEGTARGAAEVGSARSDMQQAQIEREALMSQQNRISFELSRMDKYKIVGGKAELTDRAKKLLVDYETNQKAMNEADQKYNEAKEMLQNKELELQHSKAQQIKSEQEKELKDYREYRKQLEKEAEESLARIASLSKQSADIRIVTNTAARDALTRSTGIVSFATAETPEEQIANGLRRNEDAGRQILKTYADEQKAAEALKKSQEEMARETQRAFDKAASAIEGFVHRTFLTAKSFSDVWKQALAQVADYAVSQFAKMAAAAWMGGRSQGSAGGGYFGGGTGANTAAGLAAMGAGGGGSAGGSTGGMIGGGINTAAGMAAKSLGLSSMALPMIGGLAMAGGMVGNTAAKGGLYAAAGLGALSAAGASGMLGMGGYAMVAGITMPVIGAVIAAGVGVGMLIGWLHKSATEKARKKIKSVYGVDISSKGVLQQVVDLAKQSFGGNLDTAIRSNQVAELVRLYAMTTGQSTSGLRAQMTSYSMSQSGGSLYSMPTYSNGLPGSGLSTIGAASASSGGTTIIQLDGPATTKLLQGEAVNAIVQNSRTVAASSYKAAKSNYARRELTALQLSPGTIVS